MSSNEILNLPKQKNGHLTGWEKVAAMANKMPAKESVNNLTNEDDADGMVDTSGRKYQAIFVQAESINLENTRTYNIDRRSQNYQMLLEKDKDLAALYKGILTEFPDLGNVELINFDTRRETKNGKPNAFFNSMVMENGQYRPIVKFNFMNLRCILTGLKVVGMLLHLLNQLKRLLCRLVLMQTRH